MIREHVDGTQSYEVFPYGGEAPKSEVISRRVPSSIREGVEDEIDRVILRHKKWLYRHNKEAK